MTASAPSMASAMGLPPMLADTSMERSTRARGGLVVVGVVDVECTERRREEEVESDGWSARGRGTKVSEEDERLTSARWESDAYAYACACECPLMSR